MADLSKIKVGNSVYDIKDIVAREKITALEEVGSVGAKLDFKTCYLHVYEFYLEWGPISHVFIYIPMDTPDLTGIDFLTIKGTDYGPFPSSLFKPGMFGSYFESDGSGLSYYNPPKPLEFDLWTEEDPDNIDYGWSFYWLGVNIGGHIRTISELTFVSETVI